jgi:hypothetical protein
LRNVFSHSGALEFGPLDELKKKYGNPRQLEDLPPDSIASPAVIYKPVQPKKQIVRWDAGKALNLWQNSHPHGGERLPDVFEKISDVTAGHSGIVGRNRLVLKAKNVEEYMYYTTDDD